MDTSHCFLGEARFAALYEQLPPEVTVLAIDEHTGCILDFAAGSVEVLGTGEAQIFREGRAQAFVSGASFPLALLRGDAEGLAVEGEAWGPLTFAVAEVVCGGR